jgi:phage FluMu protein Com
MTRAKKRPTAAKDTTPKAKPEATVDTSTQPRVHSYPTQSRCPRCKTLNTMAVKSREGVQTRICRNTVCRKRYTVQGTPV